MRTGKGHKTDIKRTFLRHITDIFESKIGRYNDFIKLATISKNIVKTKSILHDLAETNSPQKRLGELRNIYTDGHTVSFIVKTGCGHAMLTVISKFPTLAPSTPITIYSKSVTTKLLQLRTAQASTVWPVANNSNKATFTPNLVIIIISAAVSERKPSCSTIPMKTPKIGEKRSSAAQLRSVKIPKCMHNRKNILGILRVISISISD